MKAALLFLGPLAAMTMLGGCVQSEAVPETVSVNQSEVCEVSSWIPADVTERCKPGQKVAFLPNRFGNEQMPILFAALNCDLRYAVALTNGGVACIYAPGKIPQPEAGAGE